MDSAHFEALDARLRTLETAARTLRDDLDATRPAVVASAPAPVPVPAFAAAVPAPAARREKTSLEALVAGRGLQFAGLLLVLLGTAFFLELAFSRGWVTPSARIVLGLVAGSALIAFGARALRGAYAFLAEGLIGLGAGISYLSLWAAVAVFPQLHVSRGAAFAAMIAVTAVVAALAAARGRERLAVMALAGGLLTPALLAGGPVNHAVLAAYLLVLLAGMLTLSLRCGFRTIETIAFVGALGYAPSFAPDAATGWTDGDAYVVATLFFLAFAAAFTGGALRAGQASVTRLALLAVDVALYAAALEAIFEVPQKQTVLGIALLALAAVLLATAQSRRLPARLRAAYGYLGLGTVTLALPALVHQTSLLDVFSIEAGLLVVLARRTADRWIALAGAALFVFTGLTLFVDALLAPPATTLLNELSLAFAIWIGALLFARSRFVTAPAGVFDVAEARVAASIVLNAVLLIGLSRELLDLTGGPHWNEALPSHAQLALSLLWTGYAAVLFGLGVRRGTPELRWQGLLLFALTLCKVFLVDLAELGAEYRVGSFVGLGIVMVAASAWYTRASMRRGKEPGA